MRHLFLLVQMRISGGSVDHKSYSPLNMAQTYTKTPFIRPTSFTPCKTVCISLSYKLGIKWYFKINCILTYVYHIHFNETWIFLMKRSRFDHTREQNGTTKSKLHIHVLPEQYHQQTAFHSKTFSSCTYKHKHTVLSILHCIITWMKKEMILKRFDKYHYALTQNLFHVVP
jgi:hypothetical protein